MLAVEMMSQLLKRLDAVQRSLTDNRKDHLRNQWYIYLCMNQPILKHFEIHAKCFNT